MRLPRLLSGPTSSRPRAAALVLLALLTLAVFAPVTRSGFISLDDPSYVTANDHVLRGLSAAGFRWAFGTFQNSNWHPLTWLSHMLDVTLFGTSAGAQHGVSLLMHTANAALLLLLFTGLTGLTWPSAFLAALFAVHPQHVESVAWVAERKDVLSTFFGLLALGAYLRQVRTPGRGRPALTAGLYALSLMSKPMLVTLPFVFLLLDYWPLGRLATGSRRRDPPAPTVLALVREKIPFLILAASSSVVTFIAQAHGQAVSTLGQTSLGDRIANALLSYGAYLGKTFWPLGLSVFYPYASGEPLHRAHLVAALVVVVGTATAVTCLLRRRLPFLVAGWFWYLGTLVPVIGLVQIGAQARADRYTYFPLTGIFIVVVWGASALVRRRAALFIAAAAVLLALGVAARVQVGYWRDNFTLFKHALAVDPDDALALNNYGLGLSAQGRVEEGEALVRQAHAKKPALKAELYLQTAFLREKQKRIEEAALSYQEALRLLPANRSAREGLERLRREYPGRMSGAAAAARPPVHGSDAHRTSSELYSRGNALAAAGWYAEAVDVYREALRLQPSFPEAWNNLGCAYGDLGRLSESAAAFREALRLRPDNPETRNNLDRTLAAQRARSRQSLPASGGPTPREPPPR